MVRRRHKTYSYVYRQTSSQTFLSPISSPKNPFVFSKNTYLFFPQILVDHLGALGRRLVLGAHGAAHPAVRRPGRRSAPTRPPARLGPARNPLRSRRRFSSGSSPVSNCERLRAVPSRAPRTDGGAGRGWGRNEPGPALGRGGSGGGATGDLGLAIGSRAERRS